MAIPFSSLGLERATADPLLLLPQCKKDVSKASPGGASFLTPNAALRAPLAA